MFWTKIRFKLQQAGKTIEFSAKKAMSKTKQGFKTNVPDPPIA